MWQINRCGFCYKLMDNTMPEGYFGFCSTLCSKLFKKAELTLSKFLYDHNKDLKSLMKPNIELEAYNYLAKKQNPNFDSDFKVFANEL